LAIRFVSHKPAACQMITFDHVTKRYDDGTIAVDDLSIECASGRITVLVGTSGCGKTTSLRMINRLVDPTSGTISLDGNDIARTEPWQLRRKIGYVIQQGGLFPHRTVVDNISTVPRLLGTPKGKARDRAYELLTLVGLDTSMGRRYPIQLSGGQQQRVGVARALAADPPVLLMDEPFSAVDPVVRADLQRELLRLQSQLHKTIVFVTHDIDEAVKLGDRIAVMKVGGKLVQFDSPERILAAPADEFVERFLGTDRGIRRLSFIDAKTLRLHDVPQVEPTTSLEQARQLAQDTGDMWLLAVDADRRPTGWFASEALPASGDGHVDASLLRPLGHTFRPDRDSLRAALDAAVLSPALRAVAVDTEGQLLGAAEYSDVAMAIQEAGGLA
jgi:osmoprotectant transport system ATP-binding protein